MFACAALSILLQTTSGVKSAARFCRSCPRGKPLPSTAESENSHQCSGVVCVPVQYPQKRNTLCSARVYSAPLIKCHTLNGTAENVPLCGVVNVEFVALVLLQCLSNGHKSKSFPCVLADIEDLPPAVQEKLFDDVLDRDVQKGTFSFCIFCIDFQENLFPTCWFLFWVFYLEEITFFSCVLFSTSSTPPASSSPLSLIGLIKLNSFPPTH